MKLLSITFLALLSITAASAQTTVVTDYSEVNQDVYTDDTDVKESFGVVGLGFFSYDGFENYGISMGNYTFNGFGYGMNIRLEFESHGNYNTDFLVNYSFGAYKKDDLMVLITGEIGPSFRMQDEPKVNKDYKIEWDKKDFIDGFIGVKGIVKYQKFALSAGYHIWAPKFKFGKDYRADGFYAQLSYCF